MASELQVGQIGVGVAPNNKVQIGSIGSVSYGGNDLVIGNGTRAAAFYQATDDFNIYTSAGNDYKVDSGGDIVLDAATGNAINFKIADSSKLTIASTGLATFSNGIVTSEKGVLSGTVLIADDAVTTITPARKGGFMKLLVDTATEEAGQYPQETLSGEVFFDCGTSLAIFKSTGISGVSGNLDVSTSDVTGSTGTDGNVTIAVQAGVIKIENRNGGERRFNYFIYS